MSTAPSTTATSASSTVPNPRGRKQRRQRKSYGIGYRIFTALALPLVILVVWWFASAESTDPFWPPLSRIFTTFEPTWLAGGWESSRLATQVIPSVLRLLAGYSLAVVVGIGLGMLIGSFRRFRVFAEPPLEFFRAIPPPVMVPPLMLFFGIGDTMKIIVIATGCLWPILLNTIEGVRGVDELLRDSARIYRLRTGAKIRTLLLRGASPQIFTGARQALSVGLILMVISEMFAASSGLGFTIVQFQRAFELSEMWTGIILLGLIGVLLSLIFRAVERPIMSWYTGFRRAQKGGN